VTRRSLGRTGLSFFPVGLGGMPLSVAGRPDEARALETLAAAWEAGVDFVDTANVYCLDDADLGHNERLIAKSLRALGLTKKVLVATKGGLRRPGGAWTNDASPACLRRSCEESLRALGAEAIGLYQLHAPDSKVPFEDSIGELARLKAEGKILHIGLSNTGVELIRRALKVARVESVQNSCNPFDAEDYGELLDLCEREGLSYLPYSVVGGHRGQLKVGDHPVLKEIGARLGASPYAVTVAWHLAQSPSVLPIPGASRPASIRDSASAATLRLSEADLAAIDSIGR
jgi:aryl-alcohol dehydrogenase-like predicted oxidoreductase